MRRPAPTTRRADSVPAEHIGNGHGLRFSQPAQAACLGLEDGTEFLAGVRASRNRAGDLGEREPPVGEHDTVMTPAVLSADPAHLANPGSGKLPDALGSVWARSRR